VLRENWEKIFSITISRTRRKTWQHSWVYQNFWQAPYKERLIFSNSKTGLD